MGVGRGHAARLVWERKGAGNCRRNGKGAKKRSPVIVGCPEAAGDEMCSLAWSPVSRLCAREWLRDLGLGSSERRGVCGILECRRGGGGAAMFAAALWSSAA